VISHASIAAPGNPRLVRNAVGTLDTPSCYRSPMLPARSPVRARLLVARAYLGGKPKEFASMPAFRSLFLVAAGVASASAPAAAARPACAASDAQLLAAIAAVQEKQKNVGAQAAIHLGGRLVFSQGTGLADRERNIPVTPRTRFPVASLTKAFTGVATLKAVADGKLKLDAPIQAYVPEFPVKPQLVITPRRLAAHRSGIRHWGPERDALFTRHFDRLSQILPLFRDDPLLAEAGLDYQYSSYGYNLLGLAVERATGIEFTRYVDRRIFRPLRLRATRFDDARRPLSRAAKLYSAYDLKTYDEIPAGTPLLPVPPRDYSHNLAGGNMSTTADDKVRYGAALLRPGFLGPRELDLLYKRPEIGGKPSPMSFGFFAPEAGTEKRISISGANPGVQAGLIVYPERKLAVAVLSNSWGFGSRSGEMTSDLPKRLAELCAPAAAKP
jgi:CubicO group peptidase (beta-lactamase class C family)